MTKTTVCLELDEERAKALETALKDTRDSLGVITVAIGGEYGEVLERAIENQSEATEALLEDFRSQLRERPNGKKIADGAEIEI